MLFRKSSVHLACLQAMCVKYGHPSLALEHHQDQGLRSVCPDYRLTPGCESAMGSFRFRIADELEAYTVEEIPVAGGGIRYGRENNKPNTNKPVQIYEGGFLY
ncbi:hypothetical protein AVEN_143232-1 [Araneus ventricosus]|uniref:Uncharacterized protein n=1 Tax=Araneus ventricosus TaxID=182803 RepID=A0A4Y2AE70_ARAVE|nr:hypothetical protein AVEN_143232-1 [Araneus ventricosus]